MYSRRQFVQLACTPPPLAKGVATLQIFGVGCRRHLAADSAARDPWSEQRAQPLDRFHDIRRNFDRDQKRDGTPANVGEGDLRVAEILRAIRDNAWPIACILEQGRTGFDSSVAATTANLDYMRDVLES
jgi:hypothetical protein